MKADGGSPVSTLVTILSLFLIVAGLFFVYSSRQAHAMSLHGTQTGTVKLSTKAAPKSVPVALSVPAVGIKLAVVQGDFDVESGQWIVNDRDAFYALGTTTPIIYAHNQNGMFINLSKVQNGDELVLDMPDGTSINYTYRKTRFVKPNDAAVLTEKNDNTIILLTCEGIFNEARRLTYFTETSYE